MFVCLCSYLYRRKRTSLMLSKHTQLLEVLEIPQVSRVVRERGEGRGGREGRGGEWGGERRGVREGGCRGRESGVGRGGRVALGCVCLGLFSLGDGHVCAQRLP